MPLWKHQQRAIDFLCKRKGQGALHIDMGGGKSRIVIEYIRQHDELRRILIVCPKSVAPVWASEFHNWWPKGPSILDLSFRSTARRASDLKRLTDTPHPVVAVVNYDAYWRSPLREALAGLGFDIVVYDESHRLKTPGGKASVFAAYIRSRIPRRLLLTGTPLPHSPLDIYAQFRALDTNIFGRSFVAFRARYAIMGGFENRQVVNFRHLNEMHDRIASVSFHVAPNELQKPDAVDTNRYCTLEPQALRTYCQLESELVAELDAGTVTAANALVKLLRLQQLTSGILRTDDGTATRVSGAKKALLEDTLGDLSMDEPVVVFCRFHSDLDTVHDVARKLGRASLELSGRRNELQAWQADGAPVLAVQLQAGSLGISLVRARYALFYNLSFSLGEYRQARARLIRPGQEHAVTLIHLLVTKTVDEYIMKALAQKADVVEMVLLDLRRYQDTKGSHRVQPAHFAI